jgi:hypothetical protein
LSGGVCRTRVLERIIIEDNPDEKVLECARLVWVQSVRTAGGIDSEKYDTNEGWHAREDFLLDVVFGCGWVGAIAQSNEDRLQADASPGRVDAEYCERKQQHKHRP